jgi:hypothetical protein
MQLISMHARSTMIFKLPPLLWRIETGLLIPVSSLIEVLNLEYFPDDLCIANGQLEMVLVLLCHARENASLHFQCVRQDHKKSIAFMGSRY